MALTDQIDVYCERTDFTFWSEPLNAISNLAFIISAYFCYRLYQGRGKPDTYAVILITLLILTGIGSFLFHTFATRWAGLADIIPIGLMVVVYHLAMMHRVADLGGLKAAVSILAIPVLSYLFGFILPDSLGATATYIPVLVLFAAYAMIIHYKDKNGANLLILAMIVFSLSLTTRWLDSEICSDFAYGVHYFWHIFNGLTLYLAFRAYALNMRANN